MRIADGFTVKNWKNLKPCEDAYSFLPDGRLIAVADGITRDPEEMPVLPLKTNLIGMAKFFMSYPKESPAFEAAETFCHIFSLFGQHGLKNADSDTINALFKVANKEIRNFSEMYLLDKELQEFDYLKNDIPGCTAAGAVISESNVNYGFIADCGIALFNENGKIIFRTDNEGPNSRGSIDEDVKRKYKADFRYPKGRRIIRKFYRNNPSNLLSYGALTGEESAMSYVKTGKKEISCGDIVVAYTDGLEEIIFSEDFAKVIRKRDFDRFKSLCKKHVKTEGSLVYSVEEKE